MPTGYPGMMVLSLIPPLWFDVMNKQVEKYKAGLQGASLA
jgi:alkane 1-monooxygenase